MIVNKRLKRISSRWTHSTWMLLPCVFSILIFICFHQWILERVVRVTVSIATSTIRDSDYHWNESVRRKMLMSELIDSESEQIQKWIGDPDCEEFLIGFVQINTFLPRALVSFPGSGNTWVRDLIESSTGFFTGSIYNESPSQSMGGFRGGARRPYDGTTIVQKTHHFSTIIVQDQKILEGQGKLSESVFDYRGILLIRNPSESLISYWNWIRSGSMTKFAKKSSFCTREWKEYVKKGAKAWADLAEEWVKRSKDLLIIHYQDLKIDTERELRRILKYLNQPEDPQRLKCALKYLEGDGSYHRKRNETERVRERERERKRTICPFEDNSRTCGDISIKLFVQNQINRLDRFFVLKGFLQLPNYKTPGCF